MRSGPKQTTAQMLLEITCVWLLMTHFCQSDSLCSHPTRTLFIRTLSTHTLSTRTLSTRTLSTHTLSTHTLSTRTLSTRTLSTRTRPLLDPFLKLILTHTSLWPHPLPHSDNLPPLSSGLSCVCSTGVTLRTVCRVWRRACTCMSVLTHSDVHSEPVSLFAQVALKGDTLWLIEGTRVWVQPRFQVAQSVMRKCANLLTFCALLGFGNWALHCRFSRAGG